MSLTVDGGSPVTTNYAWDVNRSLPVVLDDGSNQYVYGLDLISATNGSGDQTYFTGDGHGSTTDLTDEIGAATDSYSYDAFGAVRGHSGSSTTPYLFTGEQTDPDTGLQYLRARYYDSATGRFLSSDPLPGTVGSPQTQNPYAYALDNPVNYEDPTGQYSILSLLVDMRPAFTCALGASFTNFECIGDYLDAIIQYNEFVLGFLKRFATLNCLSFGIALRATLIPGEGLAASARLLWGAYFGVQAFGWSSSTIINGVQIDKKEGVSVGNAGNAGAALADFVAFQTTLLQPAGGGFALAARYTGYGAAAVSGIQCAADVLNG